MSDTEYYPLSLHDALPISRIAFNRPEIRNAFRPKTLFELEEARSEEHTSELQSRGHLVCRLLLEKKSINTYDVEDYDVEEDIAYGDQETVTEGKNYDNTL